MKGATDRKKPLVYLVDDDPNILRVLRVVLLRNYLVETCQISGQAVEEIRAKQPDVVVLDVRMPIHDGLWVFAQIRQFDPKVPIILNSAYQSELLPEDVLASFDPFAYLRKNGSLAEFQEVIARAAKQSGW